MLFTQKSEVDIHEMSPLALAFVGDAVPVSYTHLTLPTT